MSEAQRFIDAIVAAPEELDGWLVYADWLLERDDMRGELINLELAREGGDASSELADRIRRLHRDEDALVSPRLAAEAHHWHFEFRRSFLHFAALISHVDDPATDETIAALFADPHAGLLQILNATEWIVDPAKVFAAPRRSLRELWVGELGVLGPRLGDVAPALDELWLVNFDPWDGLATPTLRRLILHHEFLANDYEFSARRRRLHGDAPGGKVWLPRLETLTCEVDHRDSLAAHAVLAAPLPALRELRLSIAAVDEPGPHAPLMTALAALPCASRLAHLQLCHVNIDGVEALIAQRSRFEHLETLAVFGDWIDVEAEAAAQRARIEQAFAGVTVVIGRMRLSFELERVLPAPVEESLPEGLLDAVGEGFGALGRRLRAGLTSGDDP